MLSSSRHDTGHGERHGFRGISAQFVLHFQFFDGIFTHMPLFFSVLSLVLNTAIHADSILTLNLLKRTIRKGGGRVEGEEVVVEGRG